ncbi:energy transducer TonB [Oleiagrimonas sp. C23AA]|uniref:energy transducer TonB n=1 Tax=Oleiagrimonas sp. C23AA TaxID=2719047 RepID=UPI0014225CFD|nr:energy transducer TonB [Oleiagrimonas sp. C23AA]NII09543.1 energy transducer TonB [Oleiagrimonas sp. C23AA]
MKARLLVASVFTVILGAGSALGHVTKHPANASMVLSGHIVVTAQGAVSSYAIDHPEKVPKVVRTLIANNVPQWRFAPVVRQGHAVAAKAEMHLRVVAIPTDDSHFKLSLAGQWFGNGAESAGVRALKRPNPIYPRAAVQARLEGRVMVVARVQADGHVSRIAAEQVDLRARGPEGIMRKWRKVLASTATRTLSHWTFQLPIQGDNAHKDHWVVRIPVAFILRNDGHLDLPTYGHWMSYVPGPRAEPNWLTARERMDAEDAAALPRDGVFLAQQSLHLLNPPGS